ncbi:MAG: YigZ family protein, partial [Fulvivirga sp.]|nr:YigZ family protein [Fulvivirga sp.]
DARHHCYAYMLGAARNNYRANDDGEPGHSAGDPILGQINSKNLTNILVVVVRYFGGTKLGVSGLINAYKTAAEEAISAAKIIKVDITHSIEINYSYASTSDVMRLMDEFAVEIKDQQFAASCYMKGNVKIGLIGPLRKKIKLLAATGHEVELIS